MTIHEIYKQKQQQYQEYLIQQGVYNEKLATCTENLRTALEDIKQLTSTIQDEVVLTAVQDCIRVTGEVLENSTDITAVDTAISRLEIISRTIESKIREVLS